MPRSTKNISCGSYMAPTDGAMSPALLHLFFPELAFNLGRTAWKWKKGKNKMEPLKSKK
jgi:hypothetical protein